MAIATGGIGPVDMMSASKQKSKIKDEAGATDAFSSLMNMTAVQLNSPQTENNDGTEIAETDGIGDYADRPEADVKHEQMNGTVSDKYDSADTKKAETDDDSIKINSDDGAVGVEKLIQSLRDIVTEALGITEDELDNMLSELGLSIEDLLDGGILKEFLLKSQNATGVDMLINEGLADLINGVADKLDELLKQYGISDVSEFRDKLTEIMEQYAASGEGNADEGLTIAADEPEGISVESRTYTSQTGDAASETDMKINISADAEAHSEGGNTRFGDAGTNSRGDNYSQVAANLNQAIEGLISNKSLNGVSFGNGVEQADIIRQIIDSIKVNITKDITSMELQLNPEHLGRVQISVASKNGVMQAQIVAETEAAKHAIENNIAALKETFNSQELKVEAVEVMVATYEFFNRGENGGFEHGGQGGTSRKSSSVNLGEVPVDGELSEEEQLEVELMKAKGSSVSYSI